MIRCITAKKPSSNMSDKILKPDNRLVVINNNNYVTMTSLILKKPPSWIRHIGSAILNFFNIVSFIKYTKNRSQWTVKLKNTIKECCRIENTAL